MTLAETNGQTPVERLRRADPSLTLETLEPALAIARENYRDIVRPDGQSLLEHCVCVAEILAGLKVDELTVCAGLLHEVWMYCPDTDALRQRAGDDLYDLIKLAASLNLLNFMGGEEEQAANLHKMFIAMARDVRVILVKLADRLQNMRLLRERKEDPDELRRIARETLEIFAPLAHRLGMNQIKSELEDLAFRSLFAEEYARLKRQSEEGREAREREVKRVTDDLKENFRKNGLEAHITGRTKHLYSVHQKMKRQDKSFHELFDLAAVRVIVDNVAQCYQALGLLHGMWTPIPETFDDYIATPKSNGYQSLHTAVVGPEGEQVEVQIRTWKMHMTSEYGVAAHWGYKMASHGRSPDDDAFGWIERFVGWDRDIVDPREYLQTVKLDLFEDEAFVFTPKGKVVVLPADATPVDFAYRIHTQVGHTCVGAKVNGKMVPLDHRLHNGDSVEILTQKNKTPSADWLGFVKSGQARSRIKAWFKKANREENAANGQAMISREMEKMGPQRGEILQKVPMEDVAARFNFKTVDDLYAAVGCGDQSPQTVVTHVRNAYKELFARQEEEETRPQISRESAARRRKAPDVLVGGLKNVLVQFSKCCYPVPHEDITAFVSKGRGLTLHRMDCPNVEAFIKSGQRIVDVQWGEVQGRFYVAGLRITALDRKSLLADLAGKVGEFNLNMLEVNAKSRKNGTARVDLKVEVSGSAELNLLMKKLRGMEEIIAVRRGEL